MSSLSMASRKPYFGYFGDGSDGDFSSSSGTTTLTRAMFYTSLTLSGTAVLKPAGCPIYVLGPVDISASSGGFVSVDCRGGDGGDASGSLGGAAGVAPGSNGYYTADAGGAGLDGDADGGATSGKVLVAQNGLGGSGSKGGKGGDSPSFTGGGGSTGRGINYRPFTAYAELNDHILGGATVPYCGGVGGIGGAGAGDFANTGGGSGGSGAGGGLIRIYCLSFNNTSIISAAGGRGGAGGKGGAGDAGGGAGSAGGGGGCIIIRTPNLISLGTLDVAGGAGGAGGLGSGAGANGADGSAATAGRTIVQTIYI